MQPAQDWCLSCGTAAAGRLGARPGWRTVNSVAALTLVLVTGAVAASYAALSQDASHDAGNTVTADATPVPGQVAQVPDAPPPPAPPVVVAPSPPVTPPKVVKPPKVPAAPPAPVAPVIPVNPVPAKTTPTKTIPTTTKPTTPAVPALTQLKLATDSVDKYDPNSRIVKSGDLHAAYDGNAKTHWSVIAPDDKARMEVGLLVDLESPKTVKQLVLDTSTPGGSVEVYATASSVLPPDLIDTRWKHVANASDIDTKTTLTNKAGDGSEKIRLLHDGGRFRYVLVWFTAPPTAGPTVRVQELALFG